MEFCLFEVVWSKIKGYPWWPCFISNINAKSNNVTIRFFGDDSTSTVKLDKVLKFEEGKRRSCHLTKNKLIGEAVVGAEIFSENMKGVINSHGEDFVNLLLDQGEKNGGFLKKFPFLAGVCKDLVIPLVSTKLVQKDYKPLYVKKPSHKRKESSKSLLNTQKISNNKKRIDSVGVNATDKENQKQNEMKECETKVNKKDSNKKAKIKKAVGEASLTLSAADEELTTTHQDEVEKEATSKMLKKKRKKPDVKKTKVCIEKQPNQTVMKQSESDKEENQSKKCKPKKSKKQVKDIINKDANPKSTSYCSNLAKETKSDFTVAEINSKASCEDTSDTSNDFYTKLSKYLQYLVFSWKKINLLDEKTLLEDVLDHLIHTTLTEPILLLSRTKIGLFVNKLMQLCEDEVIGTKLLLAFKNMESQVVKALFP